MQIKLIFTTKVVHLDSFRKRGFLELGSGQFKSTFRPFIASSAAFVLFLYVMLLVKKNMSLSQPMSFYSSLTVAQVFPPFIPATHASSLLANLNDSQGIHFLVIYVIVTKNV